MTALRIPRLGLVLAAVAVAVVLATAGRDRSPAERPPVDVGGTTVTPTAAPLTSAAAIQDAVVRARPGDDIVVAGGTYALSLDINRVSGTAAKPIRLRPAPGTTVTFRAAPNRSYVLYVHNAAHWQIGSGDGHLVLDGGGTVHNVIGVGLYSGSVAQSSNADPGPAHHITLRNITARRSGQSLVRLAHSSTEIDIVDSRLTDSGLRWAGYGEGLYIGSASGTDTTRGVRLRNVRIDGTRAEPVDIKPGSTGITLDRIHITDIALASQDTYTKCAIAHRSDGTVTITDSIIEHVRTAAGAPGDRNDPCGLYATGPFTMVGTAIRDTGREAVWVNNSRPVAVRIEASRFERNGGNPDGIRATGASVAWTVTANRFGLTSSSVTGPGVHGNNLPGAGTTAPISAPPGSGTATPVSAPAVGAARTKAGDGVWVGYRNGDVHTVGRAADHGGAARLRLNAPIVSLTPTPTGGGYWLLGLDGGVFSYGDASFHGSTGGMRLNEPVVSMAGHPTGAGYWLVASDGGVFSFGPPFHGSAGSLPLNQPIVGMAPTATGGGYWLVASDGGVFSYGDATFSGSTGHLRLNQPVVAMAADPDGRGYWFVAADGGVFAFDAGFHGSAAGQLPAGDRVVGLVPHSTGGYWVITARGGVLAFGTANGVSRPAA